MKNLKKNNRLKVHTDDGNLWDGYFLEQSEHSIKILIYVEDIEIEIQKERIIELKNVTQNSLIDI